MQSVNQNSFSHFSKPESISIAQQQHNQYFQRYPRTNIVVLNQQQQELRRQLNYKQKLQQRQDQQKQRKYQEQFQCCFQPQGDPINRKNNKRNYPQLNLPMIRLRSGNISHSTKNSKNGNINNSNEGKSRGIKATDNRQDNSLISRTKLAQMIKLKNYASIKANNLSYDDSPSANMNNMNSLKQMRNYHKFIAVSQPQRQRIKHRQINMQQLRKLRQQNRQIEPVRSSNDKYKDVKPRLMNHTEKNLQPLPAIANKTFPELEPAEVLDDYKIISHVGKGCFSVVSSAINKNNMTKYAIKTYTKIDQMQSHKFKNIQSQVQNLLSLKHQNIIDLKHAVKDGKKIQLIMQNGGQQSLSGLLRKSKHFSQHTAKAYFRQITNALAHCHQNSICHRDLKLQNILVDDNGKVKIIDFGFSTKCNDHSKLSTYCGTPPYMSPQIAMKTPYNGRASDIWALGVTLYLMLTGKFPFRANNEKQLYRLIQQGKYKSLQTMSKQAKDLLVQMLKVDEKSRASAQNVIQSQWLKMSNKQEQQVIGN